MSRALLYAQVPGFYAEVERAADPALRGRPVVVGGDPRKGGRVQAATPDARAAGVAPGMPVLEALQRCPGARPIRTRMAFYREAALRLRACLRRVCERLEPEGLEAAFLDPADNALPPRRLAERLREQVAREIGLPLRVGIAPVKFAARLAAEEAGEAGILEVGEGELVAFLAALPVARLPGVGPNAETALARVGVRRVGELVALGREALEAALGNRGLELLALAEGRDPARIRAARLPGSLSKDATLPADETSLEALRVCLQGLAQQLEAHLRLEGLAARRLTLKVRFADGERAMRSQTGPHASASAADLAARAEELLGRTQAGARPVRGLGLTVAGLVRARRDDRQLDLFSPRS